MQLSSARAFSLLLVAAACLGLALGFLVPSSPLPAATSTKLATSRVGGYARFEGSSSSSSRLFAGPPGRPTRQNEPDDYFKTNLDKKDVGERILDPQVLIALVGILLPFIAVGVLIGGGFLTQ